MQLLSERGVFDTGLKFRSMILPDIFIDQDTPEKDEVAGLDCLSIVNKVKETLNSNIILARTIIKFQINYIELYSLENDLIKHN